MQAPMVNRPVCVLFDPESGDPSDSFPGVIIEEAPIGDCYLIRLDYDPHNPVWFRRTNAAGHGFFRLQDGNCDTQLLPIP